MHPIAPSQRPWQRWIGWLLLLVASLGIAEVALRYFGLPQPPLALSLVKPAWLGNADIVPDAERFWRLASTSSRYAVNRLGQRGADPTTVKSERHFRIAVVGGSVACGVGIELDDCFGMQIERAAQQEARGARIETMIVGMPGSSTWQDGHLWRQVAPTFAPDLVVIYASAWDDITPAVTAPDAEVARQLAHPARWRLPLVLRGLLTGTSSREAKDPAALPPGGEPAQGRRVSLDEHTRNMVALIDSARTVGAEVCMILPAYSDEVEAQYPATVQYREAVSAIAQAASLRTIDADALVRSLENSTAALPCPEVGASLGLRDGAHLTALAHTVLAEALAPYVRSGPRFAGISRLASTDAIEVTNIQPPMVDALSRAEITLHGKGFQHAAALGLRLGGRSLVLNVVDDNTLRARVPLALTPGRHAIELTSDRGCASVPDDVMLQVAPAKLDVSLRREADQVQLTLSGQAAPGCRVQVFVSPAGRTNALDSPAGPLWLQFTGSGDKKARIPLCLSSIPLSSFPATPSADGRWQTQVPWQASYAPDAAQAIFQGIVWLPHDTGRAVTTEVAVRVIPR